MAIRATTPRDEAATAARERWQELTAAGASDTELWRQVAMAAVLACDRAQPRPRHVPLFAGDELHLHIPADGWRSRVVCRYLRVMQGRDRRTARMASSPPALPVNPGTSARDLERLRPGEAHRVGPGYVVVVEDVTGIRAA